MKRSTIKAAAIATILGLVAAPTAHAQSRDTGVGRIIAEQGNAALAQIKAELKQAIQSWNPVATVPAARPATERRAADATGAGLPDSANCAP